MTQLKKKLQHLDLFSGIGGFSLGLETAELVETVAFCDIDKYCQQILNKHWPTVPVFSDIKELNHGLLKANGINKIDIITGGYPCQPFSVAGRKKGEEDPRHLWPEYFRLVKELKPTWVIGENVGGHVKQGLDTVLEDLESEGYSTRAFSISASSVGANHKRERIWVLAHSGRPLWEGTEFERTYANEIGQGDADQFERSGSTSTFDVANSNSQRQQEQWWPFSTTGKRKEFWEEPQRGSSRTISKWWESEPDVGRVANGVPKRVDRLKTLGNSLVPQIPFLIGNCIRQIEGL